MGNTIIKPEVLQKAIEEFSRQAQPYFQELASAHVKFLTGYHIDKEGKMTPVYSEQGQGAINYCYDAIEALKKRVMDHFGIPEEYYHLPTISR